MGYNPDQPRENNGRWSSGGGSAFSAWHSRSTAAPIYHREQEGMRPAESRILARNERALGIPEGTFHIDEEGHVAPTDAGHTSQGLLAEQAEKAMKPLGLATGLETPSGMMVHGAAAALGLGGGTAGAAALAGSKKRK